MDMGVVLGYYIYNGAVISPFCHIVCREVVKIFGWAAGKSRLDLPYAWEKRGFGVGYRERSMISLVLRWVGLNVRLAGLFVVFELAVMMIFVYCHCKVST